MIIVSENADFSALGLGRVITEVSPEVEALLSGYTGLDLSYKLKFQEFMDGIGGVNGNIWSGIKYLFVPYFANTIDEAYLNVKSGTTKYPGDSAHKAGCSPIRGEGAVYNTSNYANALNFGGVFTESGSARCCALAISTKNLSSVSGSYIRTASTALGRLSTDVSGDTFTSVIGINLKSIGRTASFSKSYSVNGKISFLGGVADDETLTKESFAYVCNDSVADTSSLPNGDYAVSDIPFLSDTNYTFAPMQNMDYQKCRFTLMLIAEGLSKQEMLTLGNALYIFNK